MKKFLLFIGDLGVFYGALTLVLLVRYPISSLVDAFRIHFTPFFIIFWLWYLVFYILSLHDLNYAKNNSRFFANLLYAVLASALISITFFYLIPFFGIAPKTNLFIFILFFAALELGWRSGFNFLLPKSGYKNNTLIIGDSDQSQEIYDYMLTNPQLGYNAIGIINVIDTSANEAITEVVHKKEVKTLVIDPSAYNIPHIINILYGFIGRGVIFYNISDFYELITQKIPLGAINQAWFLDNLSEGKKKLYESLKRLFDVMFACIIGLVSFIFYPFISLVIRLDSSGPVFFRQKRVGRAGRVFTLVKFRTLIANAPDGSAEGNTGPVWASAKDPRVTRIGSFLRRSRIDELPQLWNVLRGEMSFIGPRPERPEFHDNIKAEVPFYEERYLIKPGLTGWAQVKYKLDFQGGMNMRDTFEKLQHDLFYIKHRSLFLDLVIILKTIGKLLTQEGK